MDLTKHILKVMKLQHWFERGETVLVGVSAGADSVALLHVLYKLRYQLGIHLQVAHFNHRIRLTSDRDEIFVQELCKKLDLPFFVKRQHPTSKSREVSEELARQQRYRFFQDIARKTKISKIVLAHHQNDLAETVLMRMIRGAGLLGLRGILDVHEMERVQFIRPLLTVERKDIEAYLRANHLKFCVDESNLKTQYLRNKIRLKLLPLLMKDYNENFPKVLVDLAYTSQEDYDYLLIQARNLFEKHALIGKDKVRIKLNDFLKQHISMRRLMLRLAYDQLISNLNQLSFSHVQEVEDMILNRPFNSQVHWPQRVSIYKSKEYLELQRHS